MVIYYYFRLVSAMLKCANMVAYIIILSSVTNYVQRNDIFQRQLHACFITVHVCSGKIHFLRFTKVQFRDLCRKTRSRYNDAVTCRRSSSYSVTIVTKNNCHIQLKTR